MSVLESKDYVLALEVHSKSDTLRDQCRLREFSGGFLLTIIGQQSIAHLSIIGRYNDPDSF